MTRIRYALGAVAALALAAAAVMGSGVFASGGVAIPVPPPKGAVRSDKAIAPFETIGSPYLKTTVQTYLDDTAGGARLLHTAPHGARLQVVRERFVVRRFAALRIGLGIWARTVHDIRPHHTTAWGVKEPLLRSRRAHRPAAEAQGEHRACGCAVAEDQLPCKWVKRLDLTRLHGGERLAAAAWKSVV